MPIVKWRISYNFIHSLFNYKNDYFVQVQQSFLLLYCRGVYFPPFRKLFNLPCRSQLFAELGKIYDFREINIFLEQYCEENKNEKTFMSNFFFSQDQLVKSKKYTPLVYCSVFQKVVDFQVLLKYKILNPRCLLLFFYILL